MLNTVAARHPVHLKGGIMDVTIQKWRDDLRAFQKWTRKIEVWRIQIAAYLPPNEAAMLLHVSLKGEAEEELEWCDVSLINNEKGIDYIIETLKQPLMTKAIYLKRRYLHEYEYVQRQQNETIRTFCNRYGRIERSLRSVQINVDGMYDSESRGARLLERMRLGLEQQRLILVAANQLLEFDVIREAAQVQFPDHRPTPAVVFMREFEGNRYDGSTKSNNAKPNTPSKGNNTFTNQQPKRKGRGGRGKNAPRQRVYVTEVHDDDGNQDEHAEQEPGEDPEDGAADQADEQQEQDDAAEGEEEAAEDADQADDLSEVIRCLTVTARRLQGLTLGRKFSGNTKSIAQRKAESHCAVCGQKGHWQGDSECPQSGSTASSSGSKGKTPAATPKKSDAKGGQSKKVLAVVHSGGKRLVNFEDPVEIDQVVPPKEIYGTYFTSHMVKSPVVGLHQGLATSLKSLTEYMVLDTACQRTRCSTNWFQMWEDNVSTNHQLFAEKTPNNEPFEFGHGPAQYSHMHAYLPTAFDNTSKSICLIGTSVINSTNDIPLLGSNRLLEKLQAVIYANMTAELPVGTAEQQAPADIQTLLTTYDDNTATFRSKHWDGSPTSPAHTSNASKHTQHTYPAPAERLR